MKILICDGLDAEAVVELKRGGHTVDLHKGITKEELLEVVPQYDALVIRSATKVTAEVFERGTQLKLVVRGGVGLDNVDKAAATARGVTVRNTPAATSIGVAEHALALMLACARQIPKAYASLASGKWERKNFSGTELYGKTLGLIGFGRIGQELAKRAKAFGMRVLAYDIQCDDNAVRQCGVERVRELHQLLPQADYVSLHTPITDATRQMINKERLGLMKKGACLINTARGGLLDDTAVAEALRSGQLGSAGLDVYATEPPPAGHPLIGLPTVVAVPHLGASTVEGQARAGLEVAQIVNQFAQR
ncbi:MAG: hydroxyacid dehydrogenase [Deltaproteobacteria bacterium]|nr:hydroxyacid dehydrogenase [Deltaproteobacteria bacterium]